MMSTNIQTVNMFMGIRQQNVTFCLDMSGSMYNTLGIVKEHLIQYLFEQSVLAEFNVTRLFNLIGFSTEVYPWASGSVLWNKATVNSCIDWIKDLETKTGTNTLDAILTAFSDEKCHAACLVTDDIPDQEPYMVLNQVSMIANGRPVHCIYVLNGREEDRTTTEFLQNMAQITQGSLKIVDCDRHGILKITPIGCYDAPSCVQLNNLTMNANNYNQGAMLNSILAGGLPLVPLNAPQPLIVAPQNILTQPHSFVDPLFNNPHFIQPAFNANPPIITPAFFQYNYPNFIMEPSIYKFPTCLPRVYVTSSGKIPSRAIAWSRFRPIKVLHDGKVVGLTLNNPNNAIPIPNDIAYTPEAGLLLLNKSVLARSALDGYYYKGKVMSQVLAHRFIVQFGPNIHGKFKDTFYQNTAIYDIIHYDDTFRHSVKTGDKVLALVDAAEKYAPAEVLEGFEKRETNNETDKDTPNHVVTVRFSNGKTRSCPFNECLWIPDAMYDRLKFEINLPLTARKYLEEFVDDYPVNSLPGYPKANMKMDMDSVVMPRMVYDIWPYFVPFYPMYTNILYPATCNPILHGTNPSLPPHLGSLVPNTTGPLIPNYFRQIRSNIPAVNADSINRTVVGTILTPEELDKKIRAQIHLNRHLIAPPPCIVSRGVSPKRCQSSCSLSSSPVSITPPGSSCLSETTNNSHYEKYKSLKNDLYNDCYRPASSIELKRSKSVTFCRDNRRGIEDEESETTESSSTHRRSNVLKSQKLGGVEDRFGNPKVSVGLPEKPFYRQKSAALGGLNHNEVRMKFSQKEQAQKENYNRREQGIVERLLQEQRKQEKRERYHRELTSQIQDFENKRTETNVQKSLNVAKAKQELNVLNMSRLEGMKVDTEAKDQARMVYLRNEANKRAQAQANKVESEVQKEENRIAFKRGEQEKQNAMYHNRLLAEESMRESHQAQVKHFHNQVRRNEQMREIRGQKAAEMQQSLKQAKSDLFLVNSMNGNPR